MKLIFPACYFLTIWCWGTSAFANRCDDLFSNPEPEYTWWEDFKDFMSGSPRPPKYQQLSVTPPKEYITPVSKTEKPITQTTYISPHNSEVEKEQLHMIEAMKQGVGDAAHWRDYIAHSWLRHQSEIQERVVTLAIGNSVSFNDPKLAQRLVKIVQNLRIKGFTIFYDADSKAAPLIQKSAETSAIGITANAIDSAETANLIQIANPYLRMHALSRAKHVVITPDSITGLGLMMNGSVTHVFDLTKSWDNGFESWAKNPETLATLKARDKLTVFTTWKFSHLADRDPVAVPRFFEAVEADKNRWLDYYRRESSKSFAGVFSRSIAKMSFDASSNSEIPQGVVVFGSARIIEKYLPLVYSCSYHLGARGVTVATGGSGGFMEIANAGAFDAGAYSFGIPLRAGSLFNERETASNTHTQTIEARDYDTRIPLLLHNRHMIIFAPGGSGTVSELATTMVMIGAEVKQGRHVVFLSSEYYGDLYRWIRSHPNLPADFIEHLHLVDHPADLDPIMAAIDANLQNDQQNSFRLVEPPVARRAPREMKAWVKPISGLSESKEERSWRDKWLSFD